MLVIRTFYIKQLKNAKLFLFLAANRRKIISKNNNNNKSSIYCYYINIFLILFLI